MGVGGWVDVPYALGREIDLWYYSCACDVAIILA
jgi:hypothetical protein